MNEGDGSELVRVAGALDGDTCDTYEPWIAAPELAIGGRANEGGSTAIQADWRTGELTEIQASVSRAPLRAPLLDSSSSLLSSHHSSNGNPRTVLDAGTIVRRVPFEIFSALWPTLEPRRGTGVDVVSVTLTSPEEGGIAEAAKRFAVEAARDPRLGVIIVRDAKGRDGRPHYHGLGLTLDRLALLNCWIALTGARSHLLRATPMKGWPLTCEKAHRAGPSAAYILWYAFKSWAEHADHYSLDADVIATGAFAAPWRAARAALEGWDSPDLESGGEASSRRRLCLWCGVLLPGKARRDKLRHDHCRKAHSKAKRRAELATATDDEPPVPF